MEKLIITVAPTGSLPTKKMTPHVPITPEEIIDTGIRCEEAGASILHIHARNPVDESASTDYALFREIYEGLREKTHMILQISTGGRAGMAYEQRCERLRLKPEMASLTTGSVNFPDSVYENSPALIEALASDMSRLGIKPEMEIFDVSMISNALGLVDKGLAEPPLHFDFVMGLRGAIPASIENLVLLKNTIPPDATWTVAGIGPAQLTMGVHAILMGGHVRVGLEDNIYYRRGELATNEGLVERVVRLSRELGREVADADEARKILNLRNQDTG
ncbi:MAG: 3-keto-5-aminohexanoate cleavage protein [Deltaproteobacteria bacterium]|nr:3-keto-5-aminohexanoate cleavage protein [Deltaproteobacteria bacterium]MBW1923500.1 3-keto-5-aminohexanoate cleavage protein [Deltaproteobacteria bacterium]MBW1949889.1 3-keto-5-aminohexanoate cleavage protein [Deltaproteobacteria bacterium]MBW2008493.1 3-keto-5-aminohexanoate cleavage protein [Deltaproteobacteria bacterium]MBW2101384.1 3-keto-5-aminohexanoate cleavage protein [Deltaproteobacteria bacterium]